MKPLLLIFLKFHRPLVFITISLLGLVISLLLAKIFIPPQITRIDEIHQTLRLGDPLLAAIKIQDQINSEKKRLDAISNIFENIHKPHTAPQTLETVKRIANECKIHTISLQGTEAIKQDNLVHFPISFNGSASFKSWICFTDSIEINSQIFSIDRIRFSPSNRTEQIEGQLLVTATWKSSGDYE